MKTFKFLIIAFCCLLLNDLYAQQHTKPYNEQIDAVKQIKEATDKAKLENKFVLCQVGGNWCPWCLVFAELADNDEQIKRIIDNNFVYIHINYSPNNKNEQAMNTQNSVYLEEGKGYDTKKVVDFLNKWTPQSVTTLK